MKYKYTCENCGFYETIPEEKMHYEYKCGGCGEIVKLKEVPDVETDDTGAVIAKLVIEQMKREIEQLGNQRVYDIVESMGDASVRGRYRTSFILAGGEMVENMFWVEQLDGKVFVK